LQEFWLDHLAAGGSQATRALQPKGCTWKLQGKSELMQNHCILLGFEGVAASSAFFRDL
jgi:hypothetical protein